MKNRALRFALFIASFFIFFTFTRCGLPAHLYRNEVSKLEREAGLTVKSIDIQNYKITYTEGGSGSTILLLHGFGGNKENWISLAKILTSRYHVIIPDLPGFGDSFKSPGLDYTIKSQTERIHLLVQKLGLQKFHIAGNSMGGDIAGTYAGVYPEEIHSLILIDAAGVVSPVESEYMLLLKKGKNPLILRKNDKFENYMSFLFVNSPEFPSIIKNYFFKEAVKAAPLYEIIFNEMISDAGTLENQLNKIRAPVLIIWGKDDRVLHVSSESVFRKKIKNSESVIIEECGHVPMMEKPDETAEAMVKFLKAFDK